MLERPLPFYSLFALICAVATAFLTEESPVAFYTFTGFWFFLFCGTALNGQLKNRRENVRLAYLSYPLANNDDNC